MQRAGERERMGPVLVTGSVFATWFGAETVPGGAGNAHARGVSLASTEPFAYGLCIILAGLVFAETTRCQPLTARLAPPHFASLLAAQGFRFRHV